jgi:hypothetical protein
MNKDEPRCVLLADRHTALTEEVRGLLESVLDAPRFHVSFHRPTQYFYEFTGCCVLAQLCVRATCSSDSFGLHGEVHEESHE